MTDDDGHAISFKVLRRGTPVRTSDGVQIGTVRRVSEEAASHIFDGIVIDTAEGKRFVDAPEVGRITENAVTVTFPAAEIEQHIVVPPGAAAKLGHTKTARRMKRFSERAKRRWDQR